MGVSLSAIPARRITSDGSLGLTGAWHPAEAVALRIDADLAAYDPGRHRRPIASSRILLSTPVDFRDVQINWAAIASVELSPIQATLSPDKEHPTRADLAVSIGAGIIETNAASSSAFAYDSATHPALLQLGFAAIASIRPGAQLRLGAQHLSWVQRFADGAPADRKEATLAKLSFSLRG